MKSLAVKISSVGIAAALTGVLQARDPKCPVHDVERLVKGLHRKARFAEYHLEVLGGIDWGQCMDLGRPSADGSEQRLSIPLSGCCLTFSHPGAVMDQVYLSFDGLVAACVNVTDTLGRLLNLVYGLGMNQEAANLREVRDKVEGHCPVGLVLRDPLAFEWWDALRKIRGECQHAGVEHVLVPGSAATAAQLVEPVVRPEFQLPKMTDLRVSVYAQTTGERISNLAAGVVDQVIRDAQQAVAPRAAAS